VDAIGPGVTSVKPGETRLLCPGYGCGVCDACLRGAESLCRDYRILGETRDGVCAEHVVVPERTLLPLPENLRPEEAVALPLVLLTTWRMLIRRARLAPGETVLVQAGGSGIGSTAIQIAAFLGCRVITTVGSPEKAPRARALGAAEVILHTQEDVVEAVRRLRAKGYRNRLEVIGFGLDPTVCRRWPTEELRARLGIPAEAFVVGFMGRMVPEKGAVDVIEAALALTRRGAEPYVLLVGSGPQEAELRARAAALPEGRVVFAGTVPHGKGAAEHLSCMDVCVVPSRTTASWKEQFGRVIIEAMASGVPVVGSDSGNVPVLIEETGGGLAFPEGDVAALADRVETLMRDRDLARRLAAAGQEHVNREYCFRRLAERMVGVFRDVVQ